MTATAKTALSIFFTLVLDIGRLPTERSTMPTRSAGCKRIRTGSARPDEGRRRVGRRVEILRIFVQNSNPDGHGADQGLETRVTLQC